MPSSYVCHFRRSKSVLEGQLLLGLGSAKVAVVAPSQLNASTEEWSLWYLMGVQTVRCCPRSCRVGLVTTQSLRRAVLHLVPNGAVSASAAQKSGGIICETAASERAVHPGRERRGNGDCGVVVGS